MTVALLFSSTIVAIAYGPAFGVVVVALVIAFAISALYIRFRFSPENYEKKGHYADDYRILKEEDNETWLSNKTQRAFRCVLSYC